MARILIVDKEPTLLDTVGLFLKSEGHEIVREKDGLQAIERILSPEQFDLMVTDLRVAPSNGPDMITAVQRAKPTMDVLVVSDDLNDEMVGMMMGLGAAGYVDRPFSLDEIMSPIHEVLVRRTRRGLTA